MSWPTLWIGVIVCAVFPPLIPVLALVLLWQATDGGEKLGVAFEVWARRRARRHTVTPRVRTPEPVGDPGEAHIFSRCLSCGEEIGYAYSATGQRWFHIIPNDRCWDPPIPAGTEAHGA